MSEKTKYFALSLEYIVDQLKKTDDQLLYGKALLQHVFDLEDRDYGGIEELLIDIMWLNYSVIKLLTPIIDNTEPQYNEDTGENEYLIDEPSMMALQTLAISKYNMKKKKKKHLFYIKKNNFFSRIKNVNFFFIIDDALPPNITCYNRRKLL